MANKKGKVNEWIISAILADGKNYFCGIGEFKLSNVQTIKTNIWNKDKKQALPDPTTMEGGAIFTSKLAAMHVLDKYIKPDIENAKVERLRKSLLAILKNGSDK